MDSTRDNSDLRICSVDGAARILGVTVSRVRQLDDVLKPAILRRGRHKLRVYRTANVEKAAAIRDARKSR